MDTIREPILAPPGKGLPFLQHLVARYYAFPKFCRASTWESALQLHERQGLKILALARALTDEQIRKRVLVHGVQGIEDSSRYWSVGMTIEHLMIVGYEILRAMQALSNGQIPDGKVDTAKVKPTGKAADKSVIPAYETFLGKYREMLAMGLKDRESKLRFKHPWFGPLATFQWHCLAAAHTSLHRRQIEAILKESKPA
jgi:hypothetical protein